MLQKFNYYYSTTETKSCLEDTIKSACTMGADFEAMVKKACSMEDFVFIAQVYFFSI